MDAGELRDLLRTGYKIAGLHSLPEHVISYQVYDADSVQQILDENRCHVCGAEIQRFIVEIHSNTMKIYGACDPCVAKMRRPPS